MEDKDINFDAFKLVGEAFGLNIGMRDNSGLKYLYMEWSYPKEVIDEIYYTLGGNSYDDTNEFLNIWDGADTLREAWDTWCDLYDIPDDYPFQNIE
jgi:hypothetical protein